MANKQAHHSGPRYTQAARWIKTQCNTDSLAVCCDCGLTLSQHPFGVNGKPQTWTAGHTVDGSTTWQLWTRIRTVPPSGDWLAPSASRCNMQRGKQRADALSQGFDRGL